MEPRTIKESRVKMLGGIALSLAFVAACAFAATHPTHGDNSQLAWLGVGLFGLGLPVFGWMLIRPTVLRLDAEGFVPDGGFTRRPRRFHWADIDRFFVWRPAGRSRQVAFTYLPERGPRGGMRELAASFGADGALPGGWTLSPQALADLMNAYREHNLTSAAPTTSR